MPQESSQEAANALLKLLEEPPPGSLFLLTTVDARRLLPTIRSRAVPVRLRRLTDDEVRGFLKRQREIELPAEALETRVALAEGSIGAALAADDERAKADRAAAQLLEAVLAGPGERYERALRQPPFSARGEFTAMLDALAETLADAARGTLGHGTRRQVPPALRKRAEPAALLEATGAGRGGARGGVRQREPAGAPGRIGRGAGGGAVKLSHLDEASRARMVDVGGKPESERTAVAEGRVRMSREAYEQVAAHAVAKGDVLAVAEVAGVMAAKRTGELIPLCHPLGLDQVLVEARLVPELPGSGRHGHRESDGPHRGRDGGAHSGKRGVPDNLRHGQSSRSRDGHRRGTASQQDRGDPGRLAPLRSLGPGGRGLLVQEVGP